MKNGHPLTIIKIEDRLTKNTKLMKELIIKNVNDALKPIIKKCSLDRQQIELERYKKISNKYYL